MASETKEQTHPKSCGKWTHPKYGAMAYPDPDLSCTCGQRARPDAAEKLQKVAALESKLREQMEYHGKRVGLNPDWHEGMRDAYETVVDKLQEILND